MTSKNSTSPSVGSTMSGAHKRNSDDIGWEYDGYNEMYLCGKVFTGGGGGVTRLKQHIGHVPENKAKHEHDKALRSEAIQVLNDSVEMNEIEDSLGLKAPRYRPHGWVCKQNKP
uniref:BED-type domain-containing protein n=1 Tax=Lactuca sativa TaxID=4236 RepID=A0A9R1VHW7_LACSA|nr:hypothetical protein LSAT_V11C500259850 [Lactuca sativa]